MNRLEVSQWVSEVLRSSESDRRRSALNEQAFEFTKRVKFSIVLFAFFLCIRMESRSGVTRWSLPEENRNGAHHTAERNVRAEAFADTRELPEGAQQAGLVSVDQRRHQRPEVGTGADEKQNHDDEALEVEERRLWIRLDSIWNLRRGYTLISVRWRTRKRRRLAWFQLVS